MQTEFFHKAAQDPALMQKTVEALQRVVGSSPSTPDGVRDLLQSASADPKLKSAMADAIRSIALEHGLSFKPQEISPGELTDEQLAMVAGGTDKPTQFPVALPLALLFFAAALIFLPSIFRSAGGTIFNSGDPGIDGPGKF